MSFDCLLFHWQLNLLIVTFDHFDLSLRRLCSLWSLLLHFHFLLILLYQNLIAEYKLLWLCFNIST
jgi:hypothetical protein